MKAAFFLVLVLLGVTVSACSSVVVPTRTATGRPEVLRIELADQPEITEIPRMLAVESLRAMGYTVETKAFNDNAVSAQSLAQGDLDVGNLSVSVAWSAIEKGAKIVTILDDTADTRVLIAKRDIQKCADLNGKGVAVTSLTSTQTFMVYRYLEKNCPGTKIEPLVIPGSSARLAGLLTGQLDAASINLENLLKLQAQPNSGLHELVAFAVEFPTLRGASQVVRRDLLEKYPETAKDIIRANLLARRKIQEPDVLSDLFVKYLQMEPAEAQATAQVFLEHKVWDVNGGFTPENLQTSLDFFVAAGAIQPGLKTSDVADLSYLNAVLDEIGRK